MKKLIAIVLIAVMALGLAACGTINDSEVSILWSDDGIVKIPNSLINAMERAMYTESISYAHYGAAGDQAAQTAQAEEVLSKGCAALLVNLVDGSAAQSIVDMAKAKNVPVIFFDCEVDAAVISGYDKCALVNADITSIPAVQGQQIGEYVAENYKKLDRNGDGKISYAAIGDVQSVPDADAVLAVEDKTTLEAIAGADMAAVLAANNDENGNMVELVITDNDAVALEVLRALQAIDYNTTRLNTHCIPLFTVGNTTDARAFTDTSAMTEEEKAELIYTVTDLIGAGKVAGTVAEDYDSIAAAVAALARSMVKGEAIDANTVAVPYIAG